MRDHIKKIHSHSFFLLLSARVLSKSRFRLCFAILLRLSLGPWRNQVVAVAHLPSLVLLLVPAPDLVLVLPGLFRAPDPVPDRSLLLLGALALGVAVLRLVQKG